MFHDWRVTGLGRAEVMRGTETVSVPTTASSEASIATSSRALLRFVLGLEDRDPMSLQTGAGLLAAAEAPGHLRHAGTRGDVERRIVELVDQGRLSADDPRGALDVPPDAAQRVLAMGRLASTAEGRSWLSDAGDTSSREGTLAEDDDKTDARDARAVAVMHGRDEPARRAVFRLLRDLGLRPLEWEDLVELTRTTAPYNGQAVEAAFAQAQAVVILITPDDIGWLHPDLQNERELPGDQEPTGQPRLNVVLEAGMALQSHPDRTIFVHIGHTRDISDLAGRNAIRLSADPKQLNALKRRLESAGCEIHAGSDWLDTAPFAALEALTRQPVRPATSSGSTRLA